MLEYRTIDSIELANPSRNLIDIIREMENVQDWMRDYRKDTGFDVLSIVGSLDGYNDVKTIADAIRGDMELPVEWYHECGNMREAFNYIRGLLEQCGAF